MTASTTVLSEHESSAVKKFRLITLMIIYRSSICYYYCTKEEEVQLKECAHCGMTGSLIVRRRQVLQGHSEEVIDRLYEIEHKLDCLTNILFRKQLYLI